MKAKLVKEYINFEKGGEDHIYTKLGIGERERVLKFLDEIAGDIQFHEDEPEYTGFLNIGEDLIDTGVLGSSSLEAFQMFVKNWKRYLPDLEKRRLYLVDPPTLDETIFYDEPEPLYGVHAIRESLEFERGQDPKTAIGIGKLETAKWDYKYTFSKDEVEEEYLYKGWPIRIIKKYFGAKPYPEYAGISEKGATNFGNIKLKWYQRKGFAKKHIQSIIDEIEWVLGLKNKTNESLEFERGKDPKDALDIGRKALLRKKAESIQWDWYPDPEDHEEIIDVIHYPQPEDPNLYIKLSKLTDEEGNSVYRTVNNIGEPYNFDPQFFNTPEEALSFERKFLTQYFEDQRDEE